MHSSDMHLSDKATLRLTAGLGLAVLVAYGTGLTAPYVVCVMAVLLLAKPGPALPLGKGLVVALLFGLLVISGVLMVPLLENYAIAGVLLTAVILFGLFYKGLLSSTPLTTILIICFTLIPVAGVLEQALVTQLALSLAVGVVVGTVVSVMANAFFPDPPAAAVSKTNSVANENTRWIALRATVIVMPVFLLALTNPSAYMAAIMKTVALGQQAGETDTRSAGRELVGSTCMGAALALVLWLGLSLWPSLWMLILWLMAAALWTGSAMNGARRTHYPPSFWSNALITALILFGPAIEDSASGKSVLASAIMRTTLFIAVSFYAWGTIWLLERWRNAHTPAFHVTGKENTA
ncbi:MAG TPA: DUF2955 domain-containing protein [Pseudomonadales bacterium]|nr:DUF2955 domain-containing protein [Pseudomonadales bacterium]